MHNIQDAADALYKQLKRFKEFSGVGITGLTGKQSLIVYITEEAPAILQAIPATYQGYKVKHEVSGEFFGY